MIILKILGYFSAFLIGIGIIAEIVFRVFVDPWLNENEE